MSCTIIINPNTTNNNPRIDLYNTSSYQYFISNSNNSFFDLGTQTTGDVILKTNNLDRMHILNSNGYIGISNSSPAYTLDVVGSARFSGSIISGKSMIGNVIRAGVNWQIINTVYTNQIWMSICYGNGMFVAVGASTRINNIMTSTDGINWSLQANASANILVGICYAIGLFVVVGSDCAFTSIDGMNWIKSPYSFTGYTWYSVCYGNGMFVAVNSATTTTLSVAMYSVNGVNWTLSATTNVFGSNWGSVCYGNINGNVMFIGLSNNQTVNGRNIMYSYDGNVWSISTTQNTSGFYPNSICYANGNFAIVDQAQNIFTCNFPSVNTLFVSSNVQSPYSVAFDTYGYMYVGNQGYSGSIGPVSQFNATTGAVVNANFVTAANISSSKNVWSIAIDSANNLYICVDGTSGSTTAIYKGTIASNGTIGAISVFINTSLSGARYCCFDNLGNFFVSNYNSYAPYVNKYIMTTPGTIGTTIIGYIPNGSGNITGIAFDSTNNIYLSNYNTNTILKYTNTGTTTGSTGTLLATITLSNYYNNGIVIDSGNNIYVSFYGTGGNTASSGTLTKYDPNGNLITTIAGGLNYSGGMAINSGNIYLAISTGTGQTTGSIAKITQLTLSNTFNNITSGLASPFGIVFDSNGYIYIANENATTTNGIACVKQYYPNGTIKNSNFVPAISSAENKLWGIAMDAYNNLYIVNGLINAVYKFSIDANGNITNSNYNFIMTGLNAPQSCAFDNSGNFYVTNYVGAGAVGYINKYTMLNGVIQSTFADYITGLYNPWQIAFDSANNMYVTGLSQNVCKYSPTGSPLNNAFIGLYAMGIAIDSLGNFYLSTFSSNGSVYIYPPTGGSTPMATLVSNLNYPSQLTINNGFLYIVISTNTGSTGGYIIRKSTGTSQTLTYGNGTYVLFCQSGNYMLYSNDIFNNIWKSTTVPNDTYVGIAYSNGVFVTIGQYSGNVLLSGLIANSAPPDLNVTYNNVYVNNSITLYDNSDPTRSKTGLQSYSNTSSAITLWSLVYSSNNLVFTSYADFIFNVNSINSLASNGTNALYIKSDGNVGIKKGSTTANYTLDISGNVYINAYSVFGPNDNYNILNSSNKYPLTASDSLTDANVNTLESSALPYGMLNIVRPDDFNRSHLALNQYNSTTSTMYTWQFGYVYNGTYTSNLGIFGQISMFSQTAIPCISFYNNDLLNYYPFDSNANNYATGGPVADTSLINGASITNTAGNYKVGSGALYLNNPAYTNAQYLQINSGSIQFTTNGSSISCWYNVQIGYGWSRIFDFGNGAASDNILYGFGTANGPAVFQGVSSLQPNVSYITVDTNWHLFTWTLTYAAVGSATSTWNIYCDGVLVYTTSNWYPNTTVTRTLNYIGYSNWGQDDKYPNGYIDDFRIYNRVLSSSEVKQLYSNRYTLYPTPSSVGISTNSTLYTLDVSGSGNYSSTLTSGHLTCNSLSVTNVNQWYITRDISASITSTGPSQNIGTVNNAFGNVYVNGFALASAWDKTNAIFTTPSNGVYMFQLNVYDKSVTASTYRGRTIAHRGTGLDKYTNGSNGLQWLVFGQKYNVAGIGSYTITQTLYLNTGETVYYDQNANSNTALTWVYGNGYTNLTITQLC